MPDRAPGADVGPGTDTDALRTTLADAARHLTRTDPGARDQAEMLQMIVHGAMLAIPAVAGASITLIDPRGGITTHAPSSDVVAAIERVQADLREGPCVDALDDSRPETTVAPDFSAPDSPWPSFAANAVRCGMHSVLSFRLVSARSAGALNLYADRPHRFSDDDQLVGALFADQAAIALSGARRAGNLERALATRDVIGRAKGILIERFGLDDHRAFRMLEESSQETNVKLHTIAEWLVREAESRSVPDSG